jgi:hypothetical protein
MTCGYQLKKNLYVFNRGEINGRFKKVIKGKQLSWFC